MQGAAKLLDTAVAHLPHPLPISGTATAALAKAESLYAANAKDSSVDMCALLPQSVVESIIRPQAHRATRAQAGELDLPDDAIGALDDSAASVGPPG